MAKFPTIQTSISEFCRAALLLKHFMLNSSYIYLLISNFPQEETTLDVAICLFLLINQEARFGRILFQGPPDAVAQLLLLSLALPLGFGIGSLRH